MIKQMDMEFTFMLMEPNMKVIGKKINKMVMELNNGQMVVYMKVFIKMEKNMVQANTYGQMAPNIMVSGVIMLLMVKEFIVG